MRSERTTAEIVAWLQAQVVVNSQLTVYEAVRLSEAADRLAELDAEATFNAKQADAMCQKIVDIDALRRSIPCPTCGGLGCTCTRYCEKATDHPCPDCIDGHPSWERMVAVFAAVFDDSHESVINPPVSIGAATLHAFDTGVDRTLAHLRAVRAEEGTE